MVAAMAMQWTVARAVAHGLVKDHLAFVRTAKGGGKAGRARWLAFPAFYEAVIGGLLLFGALLIFETNHERVREIGLFALVLLVQGIPFVAAAALAAFENSRANDFAPWRSLEARLLEALPREFFPRRDAAKPAATTPEKRMEVAQ